MSGRPLRFLGLTAAGWVALRVVVLWPAADTPAMIPRALVPAAFAQSAAVAASPPPVATAPGFRRFMTRPGASPLVRAWPIAVPRVIATGSIPPLRPPLVSDAPRAADPPQAILAPPSPVGPAVRPALGRWSASAWFVLRDGRGIPPGLGGGQLGGSQAGFRVAYALGDARRLAIVGRVASPLGSRGREAAIGVEWRATRLPVRLVAEYRVALDGGGSGPAAGIIAGTGPAPLAFGFDLETYGEAGAIRRRRTEPFAEGAARLSHPLASLGGAKLDLGIGGWGGAQRGAQRLDIGPSLGLRLPVAGASLRVSLDWRQRVAGGARPGSGPVLVIGSDF